MLLSLGLHAGEVKKLTPDYEKFLNTARARISP